ncbi:hypothetical protein SFRURICE_020299, partial [Spodoptera frugiperda]
FYGLCGSDLSVQSCHLIISMEWSVTWPPSGGGGWKPPSLLWLDHLTGLRLLHDDIRVDYNRTLRFAATVTATARHAATATRTTSNGRSLGILVVGGSLGSRLVVGILRAVGMGSRVVAEEVARTLLVVAAAPRSLAVAVVAAGRMH